MPTNIKAWLDFALQQMAAESYLDQFVMQGVQLQRVLADGNNDRRVIPLDQFNGKTRFTDLQAQQFVQRYQIVDHHANDASGFSATLMFDTQTNSYTLSFRSTESAPASEGGDRERDLFGADTELGLSGFAFGQLAAMEEYYQSLKNSGKLPSGAVLNVTGFSLGGHLATIFTELHAGEVNHAYIFNGAGRGHVPGAVPGLAAEEIRISDMLTYFRSVLDNPDSALDSFPRGGIYNQAKALYEAQGASWHPFEQGTTSLYDDARYQWAKTATQALFSPSGLTFLSSPGEVIEQGLFGKITQLYGQATTDDLQFIANAGVHAPAIPVFIEGQPLIAGGPLPSFTESGNTHSITLIVDSLVVQKLIQTIDLRYGQASAELLIKALSNSKADTVALLNTPDVVEGDSLEKTVEAFRKLFRDPALAATDPLPINTRVGGFGDVTNRNAMYSAIQEVIDRATTLQAQGVTFTLTDLTDPHLDRATLLARADKDTSEGLAYRYALKELSPFVVTTSTESGTSALYAPFNAEGELDLYDPATGAGTLTADYLDDRAAFLKEKTALNQLDRDISLRPVHYMDVASGYEIRTDAILQPNQEVLFGSDNVETLIGNSKGDALYGGDGVDTLLGRGGNDYLQGDAGHDTLDGGSGADRMFGGQGDDTYIVDDHGDQVLEGTDNGSDTVRSSVSFTLGANVEDLTLVGTDDLGGEGNDLDNLIVGNGGINRLDGKGGSDHLIGGEKDDILVGGLGDDLLEGGAGLDTYYYKVGDGTDHIEDADATGRIIFNGQLLVGGVRKAGDAPDTYQSLDGTFTYVMSGGHLIVNGLLTVNADFESGQFGIHLIDRSDEPTGEPPVVDYRNEIPPERRHLLSANDLVYSGYVIGGSDESSHEYIIHGYEGEEEWHFHDLNIGNQQVFAVGGDDVVFTALGHDRISGGVGKDILWSWGGDDVVQGNEGDDILQAGPGQDFVDGGPQNDVVLAGPGEDVVLGGEGADLLYGDGLNPQIGGARGAGGWAGDPTLMDDDYLDGQSGDDWLFGFLGDDVLMGGEGTDHLLGDGVPDEGPAVRILYTSRTIFFGSVAFESSDYWFASHEGGSDYLDGGEGNDILQGDGGNDVLLGGNQDDQLIGDDGNTVYVQQGDDMLDGGDGDDLLFGGGGADILLGGEGSDQLIGDYANTGGLNEGDDILDGGGGRDRLFGGGGDDQLFGGMGIDFIMGQEGDDFLDGGDGADELQGGLGDDTLFGGADNDVISGEEGGDTLFGEEGDDELQGGEGDDLIVGESGNDRLFGDAGLDELLGGEGTDTLSGGDGNDILIGGDGFDILSGGPGDDQLIGGQGFDAYLFDLGGGHDTITDTVLSGAENIIQFGGGITLESLTFLHNPLQQTLTIQVSGSDSITLLGFDPNTFNYVVNTLSVGGEVQVSLADQLPLPGGLLQGSDDDNVIRSGSGNDTILAGAGNDSIGAGAGNDVMFGEGGNDSLAGGAGADTYVFNAGDGTDSVLDTAGEGNRLVLGPGISADAVRLGLVGEGSLALRTGAAGDAIQILHDIFAGDRPSIDRLEFADGTTLLIDELLEQGIEFNGTAGSDTLTGTVLSDRISGGAGHDVILGDGGADVVRGEDGSDQLFGQDGRDRLDGGAGSDVLEGGAGEDTYVFGRGYGQDVLRDSPVEQSGPNTIQLTSDIAPHEVRLQARPSENGTNVVLTIAGVQDELTLLGTSDPSLLPVNQIRFADGRSWDTAEIVSRIEGVRATASATGSSLIGTAFRDELIGAQGNDELDGLRGPDRMVGGGGDDRYRVEHTGDTVVETNEGGTDTVLSLIDYVLPSNVENLFLRSTALPTTDPVRGEGNASANLLLGNLVNNVLVGGEGADTLWGGFSVGGDYGPGNDDLYGGTGNDTYVVEGDFNGLDMIHDAALPGEGNRLQFGSTAHPDDLVFIQDGAALRITNHSGAHGVILADFDPHGVTGSLVTEVVAFSGGVEDVTGGYETSLLALMTPMVGTDDADVLTGTSNAEVIKAHAGDDVMMGGSGNDVLIGGAGSDVYVFKQGDGFDLIDDQSGMGEVNRVQFGSGITPDMLRVVYSGTFGTGGLTVRIGPSGDGLHFLGVSAEDPTEPHAVDVFHFADGTQLTFAQLFEREVVVQGTGRSDGELFGTVAHDRLLGLSGSETLSSGAGDDTLIGGAGNDVVDGGEGSDIYVFNLGDGIDEILDDAHSSDVNRLRFGTGITVDGVSLFNAGDGFTVNRIEIGSSGDVILLPNIIGVRPALTVAEFADGVRIDLYELHAANQVTTVQTIIGNGGEPVLLGGLGKDTILAGTAATTMIGLAGQDTLIGGGAADLLMGGRGDDLVKGGAGHDTYLFNVGDGVDTIADVVTVGEGNRIQFGTGITQSDLTFTHDESGRILTIHVGGSGRDALVLNNFDPSGADGSLVVETLTFTDGSQVSLASLFGPTFTDYGTDGSDIMVGTASNDGIDAGNGDDTVYGNAGDDLIVAGSGVDSVSGDEGADRLFGGGDTDYLYGGEGDDVVSGEDGSDVVVGDVGNDTLSGGEGNDTLNGGAGADQLRGEQGDDTLYIDAADTLINGGIGYDAVMVVGTEAVTLNATTAEAEFVAGNSGNDVFTAVGSTSAVTFYGGEGDDQLTGGEGGDVLVGQAGADILIGGVGNDILNGGEGNDAFRGEEGNDTVYAGSGDDQVSGHEGDDTVSGEGGADTISGGHGVDYLYGGEGDDVMDGDEGHDVLIGDNGHDRLRGGSGNDVLNGGAGADQIFGEDGDDTLYVDAADTRINGGAGYDAVTVVGTEAVTLNATAAEVEFVAGNSGSDVLTAVGSTSGVTFYGGEGTDQLTGGESNDVLVGQVGADILIGGVGNDILNGGEGDDTLMGGEGSDTFYAGTGNDQVHGGDGDDSLSGDEGDDTIVGGAGSDYLYGGEGADVISGNEGNDTLVGNTGNDTLAGGLGDDYLAGGTGDDQYLFMRGDGTDRIAEDGGTIDKHNVLQFGVGIDSLDLVISRQANDLRVAMHGTSDQVIIENWYLGDAHQVNSVQTDNGQALLNAQVDQLIQAMAAFTDQSGLTWDQAIDQRPQDVQAVLAASWQ